MKTKTDRSNGSVDTDRLYTYAEIADLCGVTPRQVRRWVEERRVAFVQMPQGRRIRGRQWLDFLDANAVDSVA